MLSFIYYRRKISIPHWYFDITLNLVDENIQLSIQGRKMGKLLIERR